MFGPRLTKIFASRWHALWWAATILLLAWQIVPAPDDQEPDDQTAAGQRWHVTNQNAPAANPWALDTPAPGGR